MGYADLVGQVARIGRVLADAGMGPDDRVALVLPNGVALAVALLAVCSQSVAAPMHPHSPPEEFAKAYEALGVKAVLTTPDSPAAEAARAGHRVVVDIDPQAIVAGVPGAATAPPLAARSPDDVVLVLRTSGTTGAAKVVPLRNRHLLATAATVARSLDLTASDRCLNIMPLFHVHGFVAGLLAQLAVGGSVVCPAGLRADQFLGWLEQFRPTWYTGVPTLHDTIVRRVGGPAPRTGLRFVRSASAPLAPTLAADLESCFRVPVIEAYGMTEAAHQIASNPLPPARRKPGSVGRPTGCEVAILDEADRPCRPGSVGDVAVRGPAVFDGYEGDAGVTAFRSGWFITGDRGYLDDDGYLFLTGRSKEMINRGGETIAPREVDEVLLTHPGVARAVAFALPDPRLGETVAAAIVPQPGVHLEFSELRAFAAARLPVAAVPERFVALAQLPTGPTGKVQRIGLADQLAAQLTPHGPAADEPPRRAPVTSTERLVASIWAQVLDRDQMFLDERFTDLGGDSMLAEVVLTQLRAALEARLPHGPLLAAATVAEQSAAIDVIIGDKPHHGQR